MEDRIDAKRALRAEMRALRRGLPDQAGRSDRIWSTVRSLDAVARAATVMVFDSIPGEPVTEGFIEWCRAAGKQVVVPAGDRAAAPPDDPGAIDVVIVPGLAFTRRGDRLGQGGGWYDRVLAGVRDDCVTIGVAFAPQLVDELPVEPHDRPVDLVVTEHGPAV
ncbi:MAG TPA: 5-formyltetrahydrofolate cyclo-ligase [Ilumatobacter sp.]